MAIKHLGMPPKYDPDILYQTVSAVKRRGLSITQAARDYGVPRTTITDHIRKPDLTSERGPSRMISDEDEGAFVTYLKYMASHGFPMTREMCRCYLREIVRRAGMK